MTKTKWGREIEYLITDCDGTLTSGNNTIDEHGVVKKNFHINDLIAVRLFKKMGIKVIMITSATNPGSIKTNQFIAKYLGIERFIHAELNQKRYELIDQNKIDLSKSIYVGDAIDDIPCMQIAGTSWCPANSQRVVKANATVTKTKGGEGVLMEILEKEFRYEQYE